MGFFSFNCSKSGVSIPAFPHSGFNPTYSHVVMVMPDDSKIEGIYDGYGNIGNHDIYEEIANFLYGVPHRDIIFNQVKRIYEGDIYLGTIKLFNYGRPIEQKHIIDAGYPGKLLGNSLSDLQTSGHRIETNFKLAQNLIKIVRKDHYNGESFEDLKVSESCEFQGYFYDQEVADKIEASL